MFLGRDIRVLSRSTKKRIMSSGGQIRYCSQIITTAASGIIKHMFKWAYLRVGRSDLLTFFLLLQESEENK